MNNTVHLAGPSGDVRLQEARGVASDIATKEQVLAVTGAAGFIGAPLVNTLLDRGFVHLRCLVRPSSNLVRLESVIRTFPHATVEIVEGNLLSRNTCERLTIGAAVVYHLAAGRGKSYPDAFANSVVATRNLLEALERDTMLRRFVNVSSFSVYSNRRISRREVLDEACEIDPEPTLRGDAYSYAKIKQDECVVEWGRRTMAPYVLVRPGVVYGPGRTGLQGRVGTDTFGVFLLIGGRHSVPLTYVDNCADAIACAGLVPGVDGEVFNVVDDELPTARELLGLYKREVRWFRSLTVPYSAFYTFCWMWERYSEWSEGQLPPVFNRRRCETYWRGNRYTNAKLKSRLGWVQRIPTDEALRRYVDYQRQCRSDNG